MKRTKKRDRRVSISRRSVRGEEYNSTGSCGNRGSIVVGSLSARGSRNSLNLDDRGPRQRLEIGSIRITYHSHRTVLGIGPAFFASRPHARTRPLSS